MGAAWLKELSGDDRRAAITTALGRVLATEEGQIVICALCDMAGYFEPSKQESEIHYRNLLAEFFKRYYPGAVERMYIALLQEKTDDS